MSIDLRAGVQELQKQELQKRGKLALSPKLLLQQTLHLKENDYYTIEVKRSNLGCHVDIHYGGESVIDDDTLTIIEKYLSFYNNGDTRGILVTFVDDANDEDENPPTPEITFI